MIDGVVHDDDDSSVASSIIMGPESRENVKIRTPRQVDLTARDLYKISEAEFGNWNCRHIMELNLSHNSIYSTETVAMVCKKCHCMFTLIYILLL